MLLTENNKIKNIPKLFGMQLATNEEYDDLDFDLNMQNMYFKEQEEKKKDKEVNFNVKEYGKDQEPNFKSKEYGNKKEEEEFDYNKFLSHSQKMMGKDPIDYDEIKKLSFP